MNITDLMTKEGFSAFLQAYQQRLHSERSFPPMGVQKALHTASPIFGFKNWQTMSASHNWNVSQTQNKSYECIALVINYPDKETDLQIFKSEIEACHYLFQLISVDPYAYLKGNNGDEALFVDSLPKSYPLEKWIEFATVHFNANIILKKTSFGSEADITDQPKHNLMFEVNFVGDHQSPYSEQHTFSGTEKGDVYLDLIDLIANDLGAMDLIIKSVGDFWDGTLGVKESTFEHRIQKTILYKYILGTGEDANKTGIVIALRKSIGDRVFAVKEFMDFYEAAASIEIKNIQSSISDGADLNIITDNVKDIAEHAFEMQEKYGFQNDADSVRGAVDESSNFLNISLNEDEVIQACDYILNH